MINGLSDSCTIVDPQNGKLPHIGLFLSITISITTSCIQSLGLTIQRKSHVLNQNLHPKEKRRSACRRPLWHLGFDMYIISNVIGSIFAIGTLPIVILAPLGASTLVFNALFAKLLLGDVFSAQSAIGTAFILLGALMIGLFGVVPEPDHSLEDLLQLWQRPVFITYFSIFGSVMLLLLFLNRLGVRVLKRLGRDDRDPIFGLSKETFQTLLGVSYGCVGGVLSAQCLLLAKSGIELIKVTIRDGVNQFDRPFSWFIVIATLVIALFQLYYLNKGLRYCDTVLLVPLSFCTYNVSSIFNGLVYYNQWSCLALWQILLVTMGVAVLLSGVLILSWRQATSGVEPDEESLLLAHNSEDSSDAVRSGPENVDFVAGRSTDGEILPFEEMFEEDVDDSDEKTSLLRHKGKNRRSIPRQSDPFRS